MCEHSLKYNLYRKMHLHPGKKIQMELKDRGWTQRQFAFLLWKKVSEVNELIKWKRNITVQWDILLSHVLWTSRKYRLDLQNEYEYSLVESDFDISKLPNVDQKVEISEKIHILSEQKNIQQNKSSISSSHFSPALSTKQTDTFKTERNLGWDEIEKKEAKDASYNTVNLNKEHKIDKDVDISKQQEKYPKQDSKKDPKIEKIHEKNVPSKQSSFTLDSGLPREDGAAKIRLGKPEWQEKEEKYDKYDRQKIYNQKDKFDSYFPLKEKKLESPKHKENIFRNF